MDAISTAEEWGGTFRLHLGCKEEKEKRRDEQSNTSPNSLYDQSYFRNFIDSIVIFCTLPLGFYILFYISIPLV